MNYSPKGKIEQVGLPLYYRSARLAEKVKKLKAVLNFPQIICEYPAPSDKSDEFLRHSRLFFIQIYDEKYFYKFFNEKAFIL